MLKCSSYRRLALVITSSLLLSACGLALSDEDRLDRAAEAAAAGDHQAAMIDARDVLRRDPSNARARTLLGQSSLTVGDAASAEKEFQRAIELGVDPSTLHVPLVTAMVMQGKYQEALDAGVDESLDSVDAGTLRRLRGDALQGLQQPGEARREYELALAEDASNVRAQLGIAATYLREGNAAQARSNLDSIPVLQRTGAGHPLAVEKDTVLAARVFQDVLRPFHPDESVLARHPSHIKLNFAIRGTPDRN
mgnify:CR=1 FL=1